MDSDYKVAKGKRLIDKIDDINYFSVKLSDFNVSVVSSLSLKKIIILPNPVYNGKS